MQRRQCPTSAMRFRRRSLSSRAAAARVVVTGTLIGEFAGISAAGKSFMIDQVIFAHVEDGLIVEAWEIADTGSLLRQLGVLTD